MNSRLHAVTRPAEGLVRDNQTTEQQAGRRWDVVRSNQASRWLGVIRLAGVGGAVRGNQASKQVSS